LPVEKLVPVQDVAFVEDQESVEDCPLVIDVGLAIKDAVGGAEAVPMDARHIAGPPVIVVPFGSVSVPPTGPPPPGPPHDPNHAIILNVPDEGKV
jgi:hypothetical protein